MAAGGPGGAQLPIQQLQALISGGPCSRLTATLQPFTVDIIDASTQPQAPLQGPGRGGVRDTGGQLLIQQLGHQSPGLAGRCQLQGPLDDRIPLLLGQAAGQLRRPAPARCRRRTRLTAGEQHHRSPPGLPQALQMVSEQIDGGAPARGASSLPGTVQREQEGLQARQLLSGQGLQGLGRAVVMQTRLGRLPLHQQPAAALFPGGRADAGQNCEGGFRRRTGQQGLRCLEHRLQTDGRLKASLEKLALATGFPRRSSPHGSGAGLGRRRHPGARGGNGRSGRERPGGGQQNQERRGEKMGHGRPTCGVRLRTST